MSTFKPALIIVDVQEDFCPPNGSLAVPGGRDILPTINALLTLPFDYCVCTQDWHPQAHISFASNHVDAQPYESMTTIINPHNADERYETRLWPDHCVQGSKGAELLSELDLKRVDRVVQKGMDERVEMYSVFYDPLKKPRVCDSGLAGELKSRSVTHCYVVGLAGDYCVKATAMDAHAEGFRTLIVEEGTKATDAKNWAECKEELREQGIQVISMKSLEVENVRQLKR